MNLFHLFFGQHPFFDDVAAMTLKYLDSLVQRDDITKSQFFKNLHHVLNKLPLVCCIQLLALQAPTKQNSQAHSKQVECFDHFVGLVLKGLKSLSCFVNSFQANVPILYPLKTPENRFSGVFKGCKMGTLARNGLKLTYSLLPKSLG